MAATDGGAGMPQDQKTTDDQHAAVVPGDGGTRASDRERDAVVQRVQDAFAEGRLDDAEFEGADPARAAADYARLTEEIKHADAAAANASLDDTFTSNGEVMSLRMIYLHMIEEYARHLGHADLLREQIDGATGE